MQSLAVLDCESRISQFTILTMQNSSSLPWFMFILQ